MQNTKDAPVEEVFDYVEEPANVPLLRGLAESFLVKVNEQEAESILANVKAKMEA